MFGARPDIGGRTVVGSDSLRWKFIFVLCFGIQVSFFSFAQASVCDLPKSCVVGGCQYRVCQSGSITVQFNQLPYRIYAPEDMCVQSSDPFVGLGILPIVNSSNLRSLRPIECRDLKTMTLTAVQWQERMAALYNKMPLSEIIKFIDFDNITKNIIYPPNMAAVRDVTFPQIEGLPGKLGFGHKIFAPPFSMSRFSKD